MKQQRLTNEQEVNNNQQSYIQTDEASVTDVNHQFHNFNNSYNQRYQNFHNFKMQINGLPQIDENNFEQIDINEEQHQNQINNLEITQQSIYQENRFCFCLPLSKGLFCGLVSLQNALLGISLIDIIMGIASLCIGGIIIWNKLNFHFLIIISIIINVISLVFGFFILYYIYKHHIKLVKMYFIWKCVELILIPIVEFFILVYYEITGEKTPPGSQYFFIIIRTLVRFYFIYLIYSFYKRLERGEFLLVEHGSRKLNKLIEQLKEEQRKQQWELEMTQRNDTNRI